MDTTTWNELMSRIVANYDPGAVLPPGSGTEGDDPNGLRYSDLGPLAFVLCEGVDSAVTRGVDRDSLIGLIAQSIAGAEPISEADVEAVLAGENLCPPVELLSAFSQALAIDLDIIFDAAQRGGCKQYSEAPGTTPGY